MQPRRRPRPGRPSHTGLLVRSAGPAVLRGMFACRPFPVPMWDAVPRTGHRHTRFAQTSATEDEKKGNDEERARERERQRQTETGESAGEKGAREKREKKRDPKQYKSKRKQETGERNTKKTKIAEPLAGQFRSRSHRRAPRRPECSAFPTITSAPFAHPPAVPCVSVLPSGLSFKRPHTHTLLQHVSLVSHTRCQSAARLVSLSKAPPPTVRRRRCHGVEAEGSGDHEQGAATGTAAVAGAHGSSSGRPGGQKRGGSGSGTLCP